MFGDSLSYPRRGTGVWTRHLIGGALLLFGWLFVPILLVYGYLVRVVRGVVAGEAQPPAWDEWGDLLVDGVKYLLVSVVYGIPTAVLGGLLGVVSAALAVGVETGSMALTGAAAVVLVVLGLLTAVVGLLAGYLLPAAVVNFVLADDVMAAFHLRTVASNAFSRPYFVAWLKAVLAAVVLGFLGALAMIVFLAGLLVFFYMLVVLTHLLTEGYLAAADIEAP
jgi:hypothetical protein